MLTRLSEAIDRLIALGTPRCPVCRVPMVEREASVSGPAAPPCEIVYACEQCGRRLTERLLWAIPD